jgi:hypothetical protein
MPRSYGYALSPARIAAAIAIESREFGQTQGAAAVGASVSSSLRKTGHSASPGPTRPVLCPRRTWAVVLVLGLVDTSPWASCTARRTDKP